MISNVYVIVSNEKMLFLPDTEPYYKLSYLTTLKIKIKYKYFNLVITMA